MSRALFAAVAVLPLMLDAGSAVAGIVWPA